MDTLLADRVANLERTNRYLWWGLLATSVAFMFTWGLMPTRGQSAAPAVPEPANQFGKLVARELSIIDERGVEVASMGTQKLHEHDDSAVHLRLSSGNGSTTMLVTHGGTGLISAKAEKSQLWLVATSTGLATANIKNENGFASVAVRDKPRVILNDGKSKSRVISTDQPLEPGPRQGANSQPGDGSHLNPAYLNLYAKLLRGEITETEALEQMSTIVYDDGRHAAIARLNAQLSRGEISDADAAKLMDDINLRYPESKPGQGEH